PAHASEIDNLSTHYVPLANSDTAMDAHVQELLDQAMAETKGCDLAAFGKAASGKIVSTRFYSGATEREAWKNKGVARVKREMADSVYADSPLATSIVGRLYGLDPVISLSGVRLGTDKLGHFMDHGHNLFLTY